MKFLEKKAKNRRESVAQNVSFPNLRVFVPASSFRVLFANVF